MPLDGLTCRRAGRRRRTASSAPARTGRRWSGPGRARSRASGSVTKPTWPSQPCAGRSTVSSHLETGRRPPSRRAGRGTGTPRGCARRRPARPGRSPLAWRGPRARPAAAARGRRRRRRSPGRCPRRCPGPSRCRTGRGRRRCRQPGVPQQARLTAPTSRMVWVSEPSRADGSPLTEIAISPTPRR